MNHDFKLKFDQMRESHPGSNNEVEINDQRYYSAGHSRKVVFVWPNGDSEGFNYAYLVRLKYNVEESVIFLFFTSETVILKGYGLQTLFYELVDQRIRVINSIDTRYAQLEVPETGVTEITVTKNA